MFFPVEAGSIVDVWSLLDLHGGVRGSPERRSDAYIKCTRGAGLKVRGGRLIEVKLRSTRDAVNGNELWQKVSSFLRRMCIIHLAIEYIIYINYTF